MRTFQLTLLVLVSLLQLSGCAKNPVSGGQDFVMLSEQDEIQLGKKAHQDILKQYGIYPDKKLQAYVDRIGQKLATHSHRGQLRFTFTLLDSAEINAFALPGGYVYITRGIMAYLNSEAELAAVIGHEIGHVTARHGVRQYSAAMATQLGFTLGALFVPELRNADAQNVLNVLGTALLRGYGREHELQADGLGAEYLARSGYQAAAMIDVVRVLKNQETFAKQIAGSEGKQPASYHGLFSTHPDNDTRLQQVVKKATPLQQPNAVLNKNTFIRSLDNVVYGNSEAQGILRGNAFYHRDLDVAIRFPDNWDVNNLPTTLQAVAPQQTAFIQIWTETVKAGSQQQQLKDFFKVSQLQQAQATTVSGFTGMTAIANLKTPFGQRDCYIGLIHKNKQAYYFVAAAKTDAGALKAHFDKTFHSVHALTAKERNDARALRLKIIKASANTRYATLARQAAIKKYAAEQLRLLNADYPSDEPMPGQLIKLVK